MLLWGEEGIGAAIVIGGRLLRGATGGAGEVAFLPLPGTPLVRNVGRNNAGGFQELAGGEPVLDLARSHGISARTPEAAIAAALQTPGAGDTVLAEFAHRLAVGLAAIVAVVDPELIVLAGGVITAGGERLRGLVQDELAELAVPRPRLLMTAIHTDPVLVRRPAVRPEPPPATQSSTLPVDERGQYRLDARTTPPPRTGKPPGPVDPHTLIHPDQETADASSSQSRDRRRGDRAARLPPAPVRRPPRKANDDATKDVPRSPSGTAGARRARWPRSTPT